MKIHGGKFTPLIEIGNNVSVETWKGDCPPYPPFPTALQVGPFILYSPTIFMASSLSTTFKPFSCFTAIFFSFSLASELEEQTI